MNIVSESLAIVEIFGERAYLNRHGWIYPTDPKVEESLNYHVNHPREIHAPRWWKASAQEAADLFGGKVIRVAK